MEKELLRKIYKEKRRNVEEKDKKDKIIYSKVINNPTVFSSNTILLYYSKEDEVNTVSLIEYFLSIGKIVGLPKTKEKTIEFYMIENSKDIKMGKYHIFEPIGENLITDYSNSVCIVPGICFDNNHYRVGYGGGYYDRFLSHYKGYSIGLTYREFLIDKIDIDFHDQKVDLIITD